MKRIVQVTIIKEIEIEITPKMFGPMSEAEYLAAFSKELFAVDGIDDVFKYAARMVAYHGGGMAHDGLGLVSAAHSTYPHEPDVKFRELSDECEEEIMVKESCAL